MAAEMGSSSLVQCHGGAEDVPPYHKSLVENPREPNFQQCLRLYNFVAHRGVVVDMLRHPGMGDVCSVSDLLYVWVQFMIPTKNKKSP